MSFVIAAVVSFAVGVVLTLFYRVQVEKKLHEDKNAILAEIKNKI
jgi:sensor domain CHASE-containing protein